MKNIHRRRRRTAAFTVVLGVLAGSIAVANAQVDDLAEQAKREIPGVLLTIAGLVPDEADPVVDAAGVDPGSRVPHPRPDQDQEEITPEQPGGDPGSSSAAIAALNDEYEARATGPNRGQVLASESFFDIAVSQWHGGDTDVRTFIRSLSEAARELEGAAGGSVEPAISDALAALSRKTAVGIVNTFERAGADRTTMAQLHAILADSDAKIAAGDHKGGIGGHTGVFDLQWNLKFDMDLFEQNIRTKFVSPTRTVGYAYSIARNGQFDRADFDGLARTSNNAPQTDQSPDKEMNIASVSKTLTSVAVLRLLEQRGLSIDSPITPWLPPSWLRGPGVNGLTFRRLMTHTSGLNGNTQTGSTRSPNLRNIIAAGVNAPQTMIYQNHNFALFRVMIPRLFAQYAPVINGLDFIEAPFGTQFVESQYASLYKTYMRNELFQPMGFDGDCAPNDNAMTRLYNPNSSSGGVNAGDWTLGCGSGGWYLSANEITTFLAHMRYNNAILSPAMRKVMNLNFTGWMDPDDYNWGDGTWGTYHNHGGDLWWGSDTTPASAWRGMDSCVMSYPNGVQVSLLVNSQGPAYPGNGKSGYQCAALEDAFDDAWVLVNN